MHHKPNKWIAAALSIIAQPFGMLYVARPIWAAFYFLLALTIAAAMIIFPSRDPQNILFFLAGFALGVVAAVHAYRIASRAVESTTRPAYTRWYGLLGGMLVLGVLTLVLRAFVMEPFRVPADSMAPSMPTGTYILVNKWGYGHYNTFGIPLYSAPISAPLSSGDAIVFDYPENPKISFVKRLVGLPGDKVAYRDKRLTINGEAVTTTTTGRSWDSGTSRISYKIVTEQLGALPHDIIVDDRAPPVRLNGVRNFPQRDKCTYDETGFVCDVPAGHYFVMGDSRDNSEDSRYWGFVPGAAIIGKVGLAFLPR